MTLRALQAGAASVSVALVTALILHLIGSEVAEWAAVLGVVGLVSTPAVALLATALDGWNRERATALLALTVLAVLGVAVAVAIATP